MIVVEGPDGAGKTTLCEHLCRQFNLEMGERATQDRNEIWRTTRADSYKALYDECMAIEPPRVWDRLGPWSDPIYSVQGIPHKREPVFTAVECRMFQAFVANPQFGILVLCLPDLGTVLDNIRRTEHRQLKGVHEKTRAIYNSYHNLIHDGVRYNYRQKSGITNLTAVCQAVSVHLRHRQKREQLARDFRSV